MYLIIIMLLFKSLSAIFAKQAALTSIGQGFLGMVINIWLLLEILALGLEALTWIFVLRRFSLSFAYPFMSLVLCMNMFAAWLIFNETINSNHIIGGGLIMIGVLVMTIDKKAHNAALH